MHSIHWAVIFSTAAQYLFFVILAGALLLLWRSNRKKAGRVQLHDGTAVTVTTIDGQTLAGTMSSSAVIGSDGSFTLTFEPQDPA